MQKARRIGMQNLFVAPCALLVASGITEGADKMSAALMRGGLGAEVLIMTNLDRLQVHRKWEMSVQRSEQRLRNRRPRRGIEPWTKC